MGKRLPTPAQWRDAAATEWTALTVPRGYREEQRVVEVVSQTALWYHTGLPPVPIRWVLIRWVLIRWVLIRDPHGTFTTQALLCTELDAPPHQIRSWFVLRWQIAVTCHAARAHRGVETQRQWSEHAIARTTPALLGLCSRVTLLAHAPLSAGGVSWQHTAWYAKTTPTFSDALALVRQRLWTQTRFPTFPSASDLEQIPRALLDHLAGLLCYAA